MSSSLAVAGRQTCRLNRIPRSPNALIIFRQHVALTARINGETRQQIISKAAGDLWRAHKAANDAVYCSCLLQHNVTRQLHQQLYGE